MPAQYWSILVDTEGVQVKTRPYETFTSPSIPFRFILYVTEFENINLDFKYGDETLLPVSHWYIR